MSRSSAPLLALTLSLSLATVTSQSGCISLLAKSQRNGGDASATGAFLAAAGDALIAIAPSRAHGAIDDQEGDYRWFWPWVGIVVLADIALATAL